MKDRGFLTITAIALTIITVGLCPSVALAQTHPVSAPPQQAQNAPPEAVKASAPDSTPERFKPMLGFWEAKVPTDPMSWRILSVAESGEVQVEYFYKDSRVQNMKGTVSVNKEGNLHLALEGGDRTRVRWELNYSSMFGGMLSGKTFTSTGYMDLKVYRK